MILYLFLRKIESNRVNSLRKNQYDTLLLADIYCQRVITYHTIV